MPPQGWASWGVLHGGWGGNLCLPASSWRWQAGLAPTPTSHWMLKLPHLMVISGPPEPGPTNPANF